MRTEGSPQAAVRGALVARVALVSVLVLVGALLIWAAVEACGAERGCYDGARTLWRQNVPEELRKHLRGSLILVFTPWLWIAIVCVFIAEKLWPAMKHQKVLSTGLLHDFAAWFLLDRFGFGMIFALLFGYSWVSEWWNEHMAWATLDLTPLLPTWALLIASFVFADFLNWLHHLIRHKVPVLWNFHAVHHSAREMNVFTDDRVHPVEKLVAGGIMLFPQLILKIDVEWVAWMLVFQTTYTHIYHGNIKTHYGPLRWLLVTPQSHRVHHSMVEKHFDTNYGVIFCIWDRIFRTHIDDHGNFPVTGVPDNAFPMEESAWPEQIFARYLAQFVYPFWQIVLRLGKGTYYAKGLTYADGTTTAEPASTPVEADINPSAASPPG